MNVDPEVQLRLLDLQAVDSRLDQLAHRRRTLPEIAVATDLAARIAALDARIVAGQTEVSDLQRAQTKAENDVEQVRRRAERDTELLESGRVGSAKELENLQREVASLARRQAELEDVELEVMERHEDARMSVEALTAERASLQEQLDDVSRTRDAAFGEIDGERETAAAERARLATGIPAELSGLYEKLRADNGGIGAARLFQGRCEGCRMQLTPVDLGRIRDAAPDALLRCEECRRILVRTPESGVA